MIFSKITFSLLILLISTPVFAQDFPKTIDELYHIKSGTCGFMDDSGKFIEERMEEMGDMLVESPFDATGAGPMTGKTPLKPEDEFNNLFSGFQQAASGLPAYVPENKVLNNGNICFYENGKWGLKDSSGKVIVKTKFDYVFPDTINGGFVAFTGATCNYYDGATGKKLLSEDFYWIDPVDKNVFIVRSPKGYGLVKDGKTVTEPSMQSIRRESNGYETYFRLVDKQNNTFILRDDFKTQIPFASGQNPRFAGKEFVFANNNIFNLKTGKKLVCETGYYFKLISAEKQLAAIQKQGEKFYYLIDFSGNLVTPEKFCRLEMINGNESIIAAVFDSASQSRHPPEKYGLIDPKGEWIVEPVHKSITRSWQSDFLNIKSAQNLQGLSDFKGQAVIPAEYSSVSEISNGRYFCVMQNKGSTQSKIIDVRTGEVEKEGLTFHSLRVYKVCGSSGYLAGVTGGEQVLDANFQPLTGVHERIFTEGEFFVGADFKATGGASQKRLYDCTGKVYPLLINGENVEVFQDFRKVGKDLIFVKLKDMDSGYYVTGNGLANPADCLPVGFSQTGHKGFIVTHSQGYQKAGMIDAEGRMVVPCGLEYLTSFDETGRACFRLRKDVAGIVTSQGALLNGKMYEMTGSLDFGLYRFKENGKFGVMDASGKTVLAPEYADVSLKDGLISVFQAGKMVKQFDITGRPVE